MPPKPGQRTSSTPSAPRRNSLTARPFSVCAATRRCSVRRPRCTRKQSNGPGTAPTAFWTKRTCSCSPGSRDDRPRRRPCPSGRRGTSSSSGPRRRRRAPAGAGRPASRTCCRPPPARRPRARPRPRCRRRCSSGLVGVSTQTSAVSARTARSSRVEVGLVDQVVARCPNRVEHLVHQAVGAAVEVVAAAPRGRRRCSSRGDQRVLGGHPAGEGRSASPPSSSPSARSSAARVGFAERE